MFAKMLAIFNEKIDIAEVCKEVHCVDLDESFQTHIYLQNLASIQPRTSPLKFLEQVHLAAASRPTAGCTAALDVQN